ncbi:MAG: hypothetical protein QM703_20260 [Gemmatales bacterium]
MSVSEMLIDKIKQLSHTEQEKVLKYVEGMPSQQTTLLDRFADYLHDMDKLPSQLPADLAKNHDHYLHGMPKRS